PLFMPKISYYLFSQFRCLHDPMQMYGNRTKLEECLDQISISNSVCVKSCTNLFSITTQPAFCGDIIKHSTTVYFCSVQVSILFQGNRCLGKCKIHQGIP